MKRKLTAREWMLLAVLAVLVAVSGYIMLFYIPVTTQRDNALNEAEACRMELEAVQLRLEEKRRMERELEELFSQPEEPLSLAPYDNLQPVMMELHAILDGAGDYSLSFGTVDTEETIVRRSISMTYTAGSYAAAKDILQRLHDSAYRCMLDSVNVSVGQERDGRISVNSTIVFFEYQRR